jgi:transcriptional regulator
MTTNNRGLLQGTMDVLILKTLSWGPLHGYGIAKWLEQITDEELRIEEGSLYPALHRLENREWVEAEWGTTERGRRAKLYRLTAHGRRQLAAEMTQWSRFAAAVGKALSARQQPELAR